MRDFPNTKHLVDIQYSAQKFGIEHSDDIQGFKLFFIFTIQSSIDLTEECFVELKK